jgi:DNA-binding transcriptional LysR family regulator
MVEPDNILIFVIVAQFESITKAALSLGMPISTVSRRLSVWSQVWAACSLERGV